MAPQTVFYILAGCVAVAALVFVVMIVVTALRPPELPELDQDPPPPLQRVIRALTPVPFTPATAGGSLEPARASSPPLRRSSPRWTPPPPQVASSAAPPTPSTPSTPAATAAARSIALPPPSAPATTAPTARSIAPPPPSAPPAAPATAKPVGRSMAAPTAAPFAGYVLPSATRRRAPAASAAPVAQVDRPYGVARLPVYPVRRTRWLARVVLGMMVASVLAAGAVVAYPAALDPLCDDYEWFGARASQIVREHAQNARAAIVELVGRL